MEVKLLHYEFIDTSFNNFIFNVKLSSSALLEWTRHQHNVDYAVRSSRYCTKQDGDSLEVELSKNSIINDTLNRHMDDIKQLILDNPSFANDDLKLLLPQAFIYEMQVQFNLDSLAHFGKLRLSKTAHYHIRELSEELFMNIPNELKQYFIVSMNSSSNIEFKEKFVIAMNEGSK